MKKSKKCFRIVGVLFIIGICIGIILWFCMNRIEINNSTSWLSIIGSFIIIGCVVYVFVKMILVIKNGLHNIGKCDDDLFIEIYNYFKGYNGGNEYYTTLIKIINLYYKDDGKIDELVHKGEIERLFKHKDYLNRKKDIFDYLDSCYSSITISLLVSVFMMVIVANKIAVSIIAVCAFLVCFSAVILKKYYERGQDGLFWKQIYEYEEGLLDKKILKLQSGLIISVDDELILREKQIIINTLNKINFIKRKLKKLNKKVIEDDIEKVRGLNLDVKEKLHCHKRKIDIDNEEIHLIYDVKDKKHSNVYEKQNLINEDFLKLYNILEKYSLIKENNK